MVFGPVVLFQSIDCERVNHEVALAETKVAKYRARALDGPVGCIANRSGEHRSSTSACGANVQQGINST